MKNNGGLSNGARQLLLRKTAFTIFIHFNNNSTSYEVEIVLLWYISTRIFWWNSTLIAVKVHKIWYSPVRNDTHFTEDI